ncbi:hypothetical protein [Lacticaseibacillus daqingensis]|uniref:hypothetical protein n=1 Tax=Lacticaseibacillus daqingensis TaxID=2486014 RepID=UPI000F77B4CB|nr:hypothetical protein [Lacticaseibacillus daqingensis]
MRFLDRALGALRFHRRAYLGELFGILVFTCTSLFLLTCQNNITVMRQGFLSRLDQFDHSAVTQAASLIRTVKHTYATLAQSYQWGWWGLLVALAGISFALTLWAGRQRQGETTAYLLVGKSPWDIAAQYLLESLIVYAAGFTLVWLSVTLIGTSLGSQLSQFTNTAFTRTLTAALSGTTAAQDLEALMHAHLTSFSGPGLLAPGAGPQPQVPLNGGLRTLLAGALALLGGQGAALCLTLLLARRRLHP